mmetsp:Transcript_23628/g.65566  ORF Transcript_23628/g.65566 Transcript_23628/m.65566 type:complete len:286 (-) Transcript_23628:144-1001(-)
MNEWFATAACSKTAAAMRKKSKRKGVFYLLPTTTRRANKMKTCLLSVFSIGPFVVLSVTVVVAEGTRDFGIGGGFVALAIRIGLITDRILCDGDHVKHSVVWLLVDGHAANGPSGGDNVGGIEEKAREPKVVQQPPKVFSLVRWDLGGLDDGIEGIFDLLDAQKVDDDFHQFGIVVKKDPALLVVVNRNGSVVAVVVVVAGPVRVLGKDSRKERVIGSLTQSASQNLGEDLAPDIDLDQVVHAVVGGARRHSGSCSGNCSCSCSCSYGRGFVADSGWNHGGDFAM